MEAINDSAKLIAQAIELLEQLQLTDQTNQHAVDLLKLALDKLVVEI